MMNVAMVTEPNRLMPRWCVVAPTYNNARTVVGVVRQLLGAGLDVIVVNDGSTDGTDQVLGEVLGEITGTVSGEGGKLIVQTHPANRGKAAALRTGFARAAELGFTHVVTIDTDGQHEPGDVAALLERSAKQPEAIVVGVRPVTADYPARSRLGRVLSNLLVWAIGGVRVEDSQSGLRVYPLAVVRELGAETSRYAFETEVLARAGWSRVAVAQVPIRCIYQVGDERVSHFCPWRDSISAVWMHLRLLARSLYLVPVRKLGEAEEGGTLVERTVRWMNPLRTWRQIKVCPAERERLAASMGWGMFMAYSPLFGLKTVICLVLSKLFKLQPLVVMATSSLASPPVGAVMVAMSVTTGHLLMHGQMPAPQRYDLASGGWAVFRQVAVEWLVGGTVCGAVLGVLTWLLVRAAGRSVGFATQEVQPAETRELG